MRKLGCLIISAVLCFSFLNDGNVCCASGKNQAKQTHKSRRVQETNRKNSEEKRKNKKKDNQRPKNNHGNRQGYQNNRRN